MAAACVLLAILARRADVVVLAVPFVGAAAWGAHRRPRAAPRAELTVAEATVFEGQVTTTNVTIGATAARPATSSRCASPPIPRSAGDHARPPVRRRPPADR